MGLAVAFRPRAWNRGTYPHYVRFRVPRAHLGKSLPSVCPLRSLYTLW
jgi:hypothetical protein